MSLSCTGSRKTTIVLSTAFKKWHEIMDSEEANMTLFRIVFY